MVAAVRSAWVEVLPSFKGFDNALAGGMTPAFGAAGTAGGVVAGQKFGGALVGGIGKLAAPIAGAIAALGIGSLIGNSIRAGIDLVAQSVGVASNLEQAIGAVDAIFKENAETVHTWAKSASRDVGLSQRSYSELASVLGAQLKNMGVAVDEVAPKTNDLITLGADLAAQFGGNTADAVAALSSLLRGERDPIERYGVSINEARIKAKLAEMGLSDLTGEAETAAKTQATLALLMEQTADAQGANARESDTLAGAQARLAAVWEDTQAKLGTAFLPALVILADTIANDVAPEINKLIEEVGPELSEALVAAAPAIASILIQFAKFIPILAPIVEDMLPGFVTATAAIGLAVSLLFPTLRTFIGLFSSISGTATRVLDTLSGLVGSFFQVGSNLIGGLANGVRAGASTLVETMLAPVRTAIAQMKALLKIKSPSRVFAAIGENIGLGLVGGVDSMAGRVQASMVGMVKVPSVSAEGAGAVSGVPTSAAFVNHGTIQVTDEQALVDYVTQKQRRAAALAGIGAGVAVVS